MPEHTYRIRLTYSILDQTNTFELIIVAFDEQDAKEIARNVFYEYIEIDAVENIKDENDRE